MCAVWAETWVISSRNEIQILTIHEKASNLWMKHTIYLPPYESEITFNYNTILSHSEFSHLSANKCYHTLAVYSINCWRERVCEYANLPLRQKGLIGVLWGGPCGSYSQFDLARFLSYILVMTYPKIIFLGLVVSEEIGV